MRPIQASDHCLHASLLHKFLHNAVHLILLVGPVYVFSVNMAVYGFYKSMQCSRKRGVVATVGVANSGIMFTSRQVLKRKPYLLFRRQGKIPLCFVLYNRRQSLRDLVYVSISQAKPRTILTGRQIKMNPRLKNSTRWLP